MEVDFTKLKRDWGKINKEWFDAMLTTPQFLTSTRGDYGVRFVGDNTYSINITKDTTRNDLIVEMCYHLYNEPHVGAYVKNQYQLEANDRGYIPFEDTPILFKSQDVKKQGTRMHKYTCGCQIVRASSLSATCDICGRSFKRAEKK
jgi:hypothetical protein